jgi:uncharacterized protein (DUF58 family)
MWRKLLGKVRARIAEGIRHRITPLGAMMLTLLFSSGVLAVTTSQNVFFLLFSLLLASILISSFVNRLMLAGLELRLQLPAHATESTPARCILTMRNRKTWLDSFALELAVPNGARFHLPCVSAGAAAPLALEMSWPARGVPPPILVDVSTRFPFGFSIRRATVKVPVTEPLYPSIREREGFAAVLRSLESRAGLGAAAASQEFSHLRAYQPGDRQRDVAWRQSARGAGLMVRERMSHGEEQLRLWLDLGAVDAEKFIRLAAYLVWELHYKNCKFVLAWAGEEFSIRERADAYTVLKALALAPVRPNAAMPNDPSQFILSDRFGHLLLPNGT